MAVWTVKMVKGDQYSFTDLHQRIGQYFELQPEWIQKLKDRISERPEYQVYTKLIDSAHGPNGEQLLAPFLLLFITKSNLTVTFLGELKENEMGHVLGIWPEKFLTILKIDEQAILNLLYIIVEQPDLVEKIELTF
ncbi:MAG: hypothetical protein ACFFD8_04120 [Candidatus Thorarchaeota archaeon]